MHNTEPHIQPCPCAWCRADADKQPTQEQKCADLARAMGYKHLQIALHGLPRWISPDCTYSSIHPPNPYDSAEDSRALVMWLIEQPCIKDYPDHECYGDGLCLPFGKFIGILSVNWSVDSFCFTGYRFEASLIGLAKLLTAPLPVIADAAWRAIQEPK